MIPREKIDEIRESADIVDFISGYVQLKKKGRNLFGLCPFHIEKTPSFSVNQEKQIFHCFGCGEGGNIYTFIMKIEKLSFGEAIELLADKLRIPIKKVTSKTGIKKQNLYNINETAAIWFNNNLVSGKFASNVQKYLKNRGISGKVIDDFTIGYAPDRWDGLIKYFSKDRGDINFLEKAGLVIKGDKGYYDRFRNRIIFPIRNEFGKIVGFGGRKYSDDDPGGKYVNSPETEIYNKSKILYGLFEAKNKIKEKKNVIIVEGYIDLISLYMEGFCNVVAPLGTSLTNEQGKSLSRFVNKAVMIFDADEAGLKATIRAGEILIENNIDIDVVVMPKGEDPDSFIKKFGAKEFEKLLDKRISLLDFWADLYNNKYETIIEKTDFINLILSFLSNIADGIKRGYLINKLSDLLRINTTELQNKSNKLIKRKRINHKEYVMNKYDEDEELLRLFFTDVDTKNIMLKEFKLDMITNERIKKIFELIFRFYEEGRILDAAEIMDNIEDEELRKYLSGVIFKQFNISKETNKMTEERPQADIAYRMILGKKREIIRKEINRIRIKLKTETENMDVLRSYNDLLNKKKEIDNIIDEMK